MADAAKTSVSEYFQSVGVMPASAGPAGISDATSQYIEAVAYTQDTSSTAHITLKTRNLATGVGGNADDIRFDGTGQGNGTVTWVCTGSTLPKKYLPANCRG